MTIIAGTGQEGTGIDGPARASPMETVSALAIDPAGNLFVYETGLGRIRKLSTDGNFITIAGAALLGEFSSTVPDNTPALNVRVDASGLTYSDGSLIVANPLDGHNLLRLDLAQDTYSNIPIALPPVPAHYVTVPDADNARPGPIGVTLDPAGSIYVIDSRYPRVLKVQNGQATTYAGLEDLGDGGPATHAFLGLPYGIAVSGSSVYLTDLSYKSMLQVASDGRILSSDSIEHSPGILTSDNHANLYIDDWGSALLELLADGGPMVTISGGLIGGFSGDGGPATSALIRITGLTSDVTGDLFINGCGRIRKIEHSSGIISTVVGSDDASCNGEQLGATIDDGSIAADAQSNLYLVQYEGRVKKITPTGIVTTIAGTGPLGFSGFAGDGGPAIDARFAGPVGIAVDKYGNIYIADEGNRRIREITTDGVIRTIAGTGNAGPWTNDGPALEQNFSPWQVAVDSFGNLYVTDTANSRVIRFSPVLAGETLSVNAGNGQIAPFFSKLPIPIAVKVTNSAGGGIEGVPIAFSAVPERAASFASPEVFTGPDGIASTIVTLGDVLNFEITATAPGLPAVELSAKGIPLHRPFRVIPNR
jgi:sugar lactone lactonase YvrE